VTKGFLFKMKYVYAHFPINLVVSKDSKTVEVKNYLVSHAGTTQEKQYTVSVCRLL
jgi:ribosomal protein L6P/L9E